MTPSFAKLVLLVLEALRILVGADDVSDDRQGAPAPPRARLANAGRSAAAGSGCAQSPSTRSSSSTDTLGVVAPAATIAAFRWLGIDDRMRPAARVFLGAEIDESMRSPVAHDAPGLVAERPAGEETTDRRPGRTPPASGRPLELADRRRRRDLTATTAASSSAAVVRTPFGVAPL